MYQYFWKYCHIRYYVVWKEALVIFRCKKKKKNKTKTKIQNKTKSRIKKKVRMNIHFSNSFVKIVEVVCLSKLICFIVKHCHQCDIWTVLTKKTYFICFLLFSLLSCQWLNVCLSGLDYLISIFLEDINGENIFFNFWYFLLSKILTS